MSAGVVQVALLSLADTVRRLVPCHWNPERFHIDKSEIEADLRRLARDALYRPHHGGQPRRRT